VAEPVGPRSARFGSRWPRPVLGEALLEFGHVAQELADHGPVRSCLNVCSLSSDSR